MIKLSNLTNFGILFIAQTLIGDENQTGFKHIHMYKGFV